MTMLGVLMSRFPFKVLALTTILLLGLLAGQTSRAWSGQTLQLSAEQETYSLGGYLDILEDPSATLTIDDIASPEMADRFQPVPTNSTSLGFTNSNFWLRLTVAPDPAAPEKRWVLDPGWVYYSKLVFHAPGPDGQAIVHDRGVAAQDLATETRLFPLNPGAKGTYYLMVGSDRMLNLTPQVISEDTAIMSNLRKSIEFGVLAGIVLAMCIYNFLVFLHLRDFSYLWYVVIQTSALIFLTTKQWTPLFIGPDQSIFAMMIINVAGIGWCLFTRSFLETPERAPVGNKILLILASMLAVLTVAGPLVLPRVTFSMLDHVLNFGAMLYGYFLSIVLSFRGFRPARLLCAAWSLTAALFLAYNLSNFALLNLGHLSIFNLGVAIEAMLMSVVLAYRIRMLREERAEAEAAASAKSAFLATMSHEIRTPMTAIMGYSRLLQDMELPVQAQRYLKNVQTASNHLLGIINDILDLAKIEAGKLTLENKEFLLEQVVEDAARISAPKAGENRNELLCVVDPELPAMLEGDPLRVQQILMNLVSNAVKFTKDGEICIEVARVGGDSKNTETDARSVTLSMTVRDTGIGISKEQQERIFEAFSQADNSTARKFGGTGLGLNISRSLARMMDGELSLVSTPGEGSAFTATIRLELAAKQPETQSAPSALTPGCKVLVVDDNASAQGVLASLLRSLDLNAVTATSGRIAADMVRHDPGQFKAVFLDKEMPELNGPETSLLLRENGLPLTSPIILVDLMGRPELDLSTLAKLGAQATLTKPVTRKALHTALKEAFNSDEEVRAPEPTDLDMEACKGKRVLVVDDNAFNLEVLSVILSQAGLEVETAQDGQSALDALARGPAYDVVLMDMQMPGMDGCETTQRIRNSRIWGTLPVLAMTANAMKGDRDACLAAGMNDHLAKPIDIAEFYSVLRRWTKRGDVSC